jgi:hypothetical protein
MKSVTFENIFNRERFVCWTADLRSPEYIDGVEYLRVHRVGSDRTLLVKRDALRPVKERALS